MSGDHVNAPESAPELLPLSPTSLPPPGAPLAHFVSQAPFDAHEAEALSPEQEKFYLASQLRLMWVKFKRHRLALVSGVFLAVMYASIVICEFLAPYNYQTRDTEFIRAPPQAIHLFHEGKFVGPFVYGYAYRLNMDNLKREYTPDKQKVYPIRFLCRGDGYYFWGLVPGDLHLACPAKAGVLDASQGKRLRELLAEQGSGGSDGGSIRGLARLLRRNPSDAERVLWKALTTDRRFAGQFRRQTPVGRHIPDFVSFIHRIAIEIVNPNEAPTIPTDRAARREWLEARGYRVVEIEAAAVESDLAPVMDGLAGKMAVSEGRQS